MLDGQILTRAGMTFAQVSTLSLDILGKLFNLSKSISLMKNKASDTRFLGLWWELGEIVNIKCLRPGKGSTYHGCDFHCRIREMWKEYLR